MFHTKLSYMDFIKVYAEQHIQAGCFSGIQGLSHNIT
jgi:hypothetical protein